MFMAAVGREAIKQGETLRYEIHLLELDLKPGEYHSQFSGHKKQYQVLAS